MLLLVLAGLCISSFFSFAICQLFLGVPLFAQPELLDDLGNADLIPAFRVIQMTQALGILILPSIAYLWIVGTKTELRYMFRKPDRQPVLISLVFFLTAFPLINFLAHWNAGLELPTGIGRWLEGKEAEVGTLTERFLYMPDLWLLLVNLIMIGLLPAVGEELIFRGLIQRGLHRLTGNPHVAIWLAAILFSAVHIQFLGFVPRMLMGAAMGYLLYWSGNIWYPIIAHFTNNSVAVILAFSAQRGIIDPNLEDAGTGNVTLAVFSLCFSLMLLYLFRQHQQARISAQ